MSKRTKKERCSIKVKLKKKINEDDWQKISTGTIGKRSLISSRSNVINTPTSLCASIVSRSVSNIQLFY